MGISENDFLDEIKKDFLNEVTFDLDQAEESYLKLENPEQRDEELTKIFRLAHSLKGTGAAVGFLDLAGFAHVVEDFLAILRADTSLVSDEAISILLKAGDAFRTRIEMLKHDDTSPWHIDVLKSEVVNFTKLLDKQKSPTAVGEKPKTSKEDTSFDDFFKKAEPNTAPTPLEKETSENTTSQPQLNKQKNSESSMVKIDAHRVDTVLNLVGELVVTKSQLMNHITNDMVDGKLSAIASLMDKIIRELQDKTLSMRMTPLKQLFIKTQRIVRDVSIKLNKDVHFEMTGEDTEIDRTLVEILSDPLMHMIRNAMDHGIESTEVRKKNGKPERGSIKLSASQEGGRVVVRIQDDGRGIDREKILSKALKNNLISANTDTAKMTDRQVFELLCAPGFSTAEVVTDLSGRGVGLDVVRSNIEKMRGTLEIQSTLGKGTTFVVSLPLTTSITEGILLEIGNNIYILPIGGVKEILSLEIKNIVPLSGGDLVLSHRDHVYPIIHLPCLLENSCDKESINDESTVVLIEAGANIVGIIVDRVLGQTQVVLKSLGETFRNDKGIAGGAIMGDGRVALVLDPIGLCEHFEEKKYEIKINFLNEAA